MKKNLRANVGKETLNKKPDLSQPRRMFAGSNMQAGQGFQAKFNMNQSGYKDHVEKQQALRGRPVLTFLWHQGL